METLRKASVSPVNLVHKCTTDVKFQGYDIPKGTHIFGNIHDAHHDPEVWGDPEVFRPERFLTPDGTSIVKHESLIPFSTGKRVCIGKTFARDSLFLFITNLAHTFHILPPEAPEEMPTMEIKFGQLTLGPVSSMMCMKERHQENELSPLDFISTPIISNSVNRSYQG
jgi:cytochrome P450